MAVDQGSPRKQRPDNHGPSYAGVPPHESHQDERDTASLGTLGVASSRVLEARHPALGHLVVSVHTLDRPLGLRAGGKGR